MFKSNGEVKGVNYDGNFKIGKDHMNPAWLAMEDKLSGIPKYIAANIKLKPGLTMLIGVGTGNAAFEKEFAETLAIDHKADTAVFCIDPSMTPVHHGGPAMDTPFITPICNSIDNFVKIKPLLHAGVGTVILSIIWPNGHNIQEEDDGEFYDIEAVKKLKPDYIVAMYSPTCSGSKFFLTYMEKFKPISEFKIDKVKTDLCIEYIGVIEKLIATIEAQDTKCSKMAFMLGIINNFPPSSFSPVWRDLLSEKVAMYAEMAYLDKAECIEALNDNLKDYKENAIFDATIRLVKC